MLSSATHINTSAMMSNCKRCSLILLIGVQLNLLVISGRTIELTQSICDNEYKINKNDPLVISFDGRQLADECLVTIKVDGSDDANTVCIDQNLMDISASNVVIEYHDKVESSDPDMSYRDISTNQSRWCSVFDEVVVVFKSRTGPEGSAKVQLELTAHKNELAGKIVDAAHRILYTMIGVAVAIAVILILSVVVCCVCINRRKRQAAQQGVVFNSHQPQVTYRDGQATYQPVVT